MDNRCYVRLESAKYMKDTIREERSRLRRGGAKRILDGFRLLFAGLGAIGVTYAVVFNYAEWIPAIKEFLDRRLN